MWHGRAGKHGTTVPKFCPAAAQFMRITSPFHFYFSFPLSFPASRFPPLLLTFTPFLFQFCSAAAVPVPLLFFISSSRLASSRVPSRPLQPFCVLPFCSLCVLRSAPFSEFPLPFCRCSRSALRLCPLPSALARRLAPPPSPLCSLSLSQCHSLWCLSLRLPCHCVSASPGQGVYLRTQLSTSRIQVSHLLGLPLCFIA